MLKGEVAIIKLYLNSETIENVYVTYNEGSSVLNKAQGNDTIPTVVWIIVIIFGINYLLGVLIILLRIKKKKKSFTMGTNKINERYT